MNKIKFILNKIMGDFEYRSVILYYGSFMLNMFYAGLNMINVLIFSSKWYGIMTIYYVILGFLRLQCRQFTKGIINQNQNGEFKLRELKAYYSSGILFVLLAVIFVIFTLGIAIEGRGKKYSDIVTIAMAVYTFGKLAFAILNQIKVRKSSRLTLKLIKYISFSEVMFSVLSLQVAMILTFDDSGTNQPVMNMLTGIAVSVIIGIIGINIIRESKTKWNQR